MSHGDTNVGGETNPISSRAATYADTARTSSPSSSPTSPLSDYQKKCDTIFHDESLPKGMNLHVSSNTFNSLIFSIPRKVSNDIPFGRILMDTYDITSCSTEQHPHHSSFEVTAADPLIYSAMVQHGLTINGTVYTPTIPSPPGFRAVKVNFRRIPQHYKLDDILKLFSSYGKPLHIGMYYRDHPKRKIWTQEGYVLFEAVDDLSHPELPREIKVGPGAPVILNTVGEPPSPKYTNTNTNTNTNNNNNNNNKDSNKTHPAKYVQQKNAEGFQLVQHKKRTGKKRSKGNTTTATHMDGVEPTAPATPSTQDVSSSQETPNVQATSVVQAAPIAQAASIPSITPQEAAQMPKMKVSIKRACSAIILLIGLTIPAIEANTACTTNDDCPLGS
ncbi:hypothetical protein BGZ95_004648, partial [Linnemannia exigua]